MPWCLELSDTKVYAPQETGPPAGHELSTNPHGRTKLTIFDLLRKELLKLPNPEKAAFLGHYRIDTADLGCLQGESEVSKSTIWST